MKKLDSDKYEWNPIEKRVELIEFDNSYDDSYYQDDNN